MKKRTEKKEKQVKKLNKWKIAFLTLLGIILGLSLLVTVRIFSNREPEQNSNDQTEIKAGEPNFQVESTKKQLNTIIEYYLNDFQKDSKLTYRFYLENEALINGTFQILGSDIQFYLYFDPFVLENGDVLLKAKSLSIGTLGLPISEVMKYIESSFKVPDWIEVDSKQQTITVHLSKFSLDNGIHFTADKIDLIEDEIRFNVFLPIETTENSSE